MAKTSKGRMLEFVVRTRNARSYHLYVKEGKPIRINIQSVVKQETIYPKDPTFNGECEGIIFCLYSNQNAASLKKLYDSLEEEKWKKEVKSYIDRLITCYEEKLAILKS